MLQVSWDHPAMEKSQRKKQQINQSRKTRSSSSFAIKLHLIWILKTETGDGLDFRDETERKREKENEKEMF